MGNERKLSVAETWRLALVDPTHRGEGVIEPGQMVHAIGSHVWSVLRELLGGGTRFVCSFPSRAVRLDA